jgi:general transcription factor 3C polypeptide 3 (transcription factor C subunit 4)
MHANVVLSHDVLEYAPLFAEIADAYFERDMFADARPIYELLGTDAGVRLSFYETQCCGC